MKAKNIIDRYIKYFTKRGHVQIPNASLVPENDPTTLFTSSGMQPLVPYLLGEKHPSGKRLVNVQNSFRAQDIEEIGDNRHTTFFRMLGNWSLGDYFKTDQLTWIFDFLIDPKEGLGLDPHKLYVTVFQGEGEIGKDTESIEIWKTLFQTVHIHARENERIFAYDAKKNWWSRAGVPANMPLGEPGGPDSEVFYDFGEELKIHENSAWKDEKCHVNCDCGRYIEIANSVFMQFKKTESGFEELPQKNVDFGGGLERFLLAVENQPDVFQTSLFKPIINIIETATQKEYLEYAREMRIITDHFVAGVMIAANGIYPSNKEQGYILRRLLRRGLDNVYQLGGSDIEPILQTIFEQYKDTDPYLIEKFEMIKNLILEEEGKYKKAQHEAKKFVEKRYGKVPPSSQSSPRGRRGLDEGKKNLMGDELMGVTEISADDAFTLYTTHGLSPTQIKSLGYTFDDQKFASLMEEHQKVSKKGAEKKFAGGLADHSEKTIMGHTATHLMHQAIRDILGNNVHQSGSNITAERVRFDFNYDKKMTPEQLKNVEDIVNQKIQENLPVHYEFMPLAKARKLGAIGLFDEKYGEKVKIYFIGGSNPHDGESFETESPSSQPSPKGGRRSEEVKTTDRAYSIEFCGGPHVEFTGKLKKFKIIKEEGLGKGFRRIYAVVE